MKLPDGMPFYTIEDGKAKVWYPDGDLLAEVYGNLGGLEAVDEEELAQWIVEAYIERQRRQT